MANPQLEKGHIRIANEIIDEVLRRDFSKRQQNILHLIWRLSYGCNKKTATIPRLNNFVLCGVGKQNIRAELEHLETCGVIFWDRSTNEFTFNKNHKEWIITPIKGWKSEDFSDLLRLNIQEKFLKQEQIEDKNSSQNKNYNKNKNDDSSQNKNHKRKRVLKLRTFKFLKQEHQDGLILRRSKSGWVPKDSIKDIKDKDSKDINNNNNPHTFFEQHIAPLNPYVIEQITDWTETFPDDVVVFSMKLSVDANKRSMGYINRVLTNWKNEGVKNLADAKRSNYEFRNQQKTKHNGPSPFPKKEIVPDWFEKQKKQTKQQPQQNNELSLEEQKKAEAEMAALLKQYAK